MGQGPLIFALIFFTTFSVYFFLGIYIIHMNSKSSQNRYFFILTISLCFWSFGFSIANFAKTEEACLIWRRIAALGWSMAYSLMLHFFLILTDRKKVLKLWWFKVFLYIPGLISMYVFAISNKMASQQYNLVSTRYGWTNLPVNNGWDIFFYCYFASYSIACLLVVWDWKRRTNDGRLSKQQANPITYALLVALILGTFTDLILGLILTTPLPQMAPVVILIPTSAVYYSIKRYGLFSSNDSEQKELILTGKTRMVLYRYLSTAYIAGAIICFLPYYLPHMIYGEGNLSNTIYTSVIFMLFGIAILIFQIVIKKQHIMDVLVLLVMLISIPVITLRFIEFSSVTVWAFPIILMVISLVFNRTIPLILISVVAIITQLLIWINSPSHIIYLDEFDFLIRMGIFVIALMIGLIVNKIYISKLKETAYQSDFNRMISEISFEFVGVNKENFDDKADFLLEKIGGFFQASHAYIYLFNNDRYTLTYSYEWRNQEVGFKNEVKKEIALSDFPWLMHYIINNKPFCIPDINKLPISAKAEKEYLIKNKVKSIVTIPIEGNGEVRGFIGIESIETHRECSDAHINHIRILANMLADGITKIKAEHEIEYMAYYDHLTGLPNRTLFLDRLNQAINMAKRNEHLLGIILIDLDGFKAINDTMGHSVGDTILKEVSKSLKGFLRKSDTIARFAGDEFILIVNNASNIEDIKEVADRLFERFKKPFYIGKHELFITGSAGISIYPIDGDDTDALVKNADTAMFEAKSMGKNQYVLCTHEMKEDVKQKLILSNSLYRVKERGELFIHYQPLINLDKGQITGVEALLRWRHPVYGMISPNVFIPLAEKIGLINTIGEWVLMMACTQNKQWQDMGYGPIRMAVNISAAQFKSPHMVSTVERILKETKLDPKYLDLEITETIAINETNQVVDVLEKLKELGVTISIDDFGTEYSSLSRLKLLPIDRIKIDMQFIRSIEESEKDKAITEVIINLAKSLGLGVVAEGVETANQLEFLEMKKCDEVQGYYYYRPGPVEDIEELLGHKQGHNN